VETFIFPFSITGALLAASAARTVPGDTGVGLDFDQRPPADLHGLDAGDFDLAVNSHISTSVVSIVKP